MTAGALAYVTSNIAACPECHAKRGTPCTPVTQGAHRARLDREGWGCLCSDSGYDETCPIHGDYPNGCEPCSVATDANGNDRSGENHNACESGEGW